EGQRIAAQATGLRSRVIRRAKPNRPLDLRERLRNRKLSSVRAKVEHGFHVVKSLWGFTKVRYRGLAKNTVRVFALFALSNLYLARKHLLLPQERCLQ
ncbi:MAG: transposase, partial [Burkholderiales bacterium]